MYANPDINHSLRAWNWKTPIVINETDVSQMVPLVAILTAKGQLISEWNFVVFQSPKKANQIFDRYLP